MEGKSVAPIQEQMFSTEEGIQVLEVNLAYVTEVDTSGNLKTFNQLFAQNLCSPGKTSLYFITVCPLEENAQARGHKTGLPKSDQSHHKFINRSDMPDWLLHISLRYCSIPRMLTSKFCEPMRLWVLLDLHCCCLS